MQALSAKLLWGIFYVLNMESIFVKNGWLLLSLF